MLSMKDQSIETGDIVKLKAGGTKFMTVNSIDGAFAECVWPGDRGEKVYRIFELSLLELVSKKESNNR
jgi:uncharacterized protein YodC (DUF2158 family)